jgi:pilus assembly protein CpaF
MSSLHAGSALDALSRLETMVVLGLGESVPLEAVRDQVRGAVDVLVAMRREPDGRRRVVAVERCTRSATDPEPAP